MHQHCTYLSSLLGCDLTVSADPQPGDLLYPKVAIITKGSFIKCTKMCLLYTLDFIGSESLSSLQFP